MKHLIFLITSFILFSCNQNTDKNISIKKPADTISLSEIKKADSKRVIENEGKQMYDNLKLDSLLIAVLKIANEYKNNLSLQGQIDSSKYADKNIFATYVLGNLFSENKRHLFVKRYIEGFSVERKLYSDIYVLRDSKFKKVVSDTADIGYSQDTLLDINSDGYKDYIVSSYSGAGCCPRDARNGYLYDNQNGEFKPVSFFNPEFNLSKKIFYESEYGYPGEVSIDKYKWNGLEKVMLESIFPTTVNRPDSFARPYTFTKVRYPGKKSQLLKSVPDEYKKLEIYKYFISYQD